MRKPEYTLAVLFAAAFIVGFLGAALVADVHRLVLVARDTRAQVLTLGERLEEQRGKTVR